MSAHRALGGAEGADHGREGTVFIWELACLDLRQKLATTLGQPGGGGVPPLATHTSPGSHRRVAAFRSGIRSTSRRILGAVAPGYETDRRCLPKRQVGLATDEEGFVLENECTIAFG